MRRWPPPRGCRRVPSAITWFAPQSENQSRPSCQRGDSPNTTPSIRTSAAPTLSLLLADGLVGQTAPRSGTHRTPPAPPRPPPESAPPPPPWPAWAGHLARPETGQLHRPTGPRGARGQRSTPSPARRGSPNTHSAQSSVAARTEYPVLERRCAAATHYRRRTERRQCARCSRRGLITQRYENRSTSVSSPCRIFAFENQVLETGSVARPTPRPRPAQPGTLEPRDRPPHRRRRHLPRTRGPDPPRRCSPSRTTRRMDLRCAATSASTSSPRAG